MNNKLYTAGEFAKLCGTTKETLFVYDRKNIIKPKLIGENGYRYYSYDQFASFSIVKSLQTAGASLAEIGEIFNSQDGEKLIKLLEENRALLAKRQIELMHMQNYITKILDSVDFSYNYDDKIHYRYCSEEYLIALPTGYKTPPQEGYFYSYECSTELNEYMHSKGYCQYGAIDIYDIVINENFKKDEFYPSYYWSKISYQAKDEALYIKPSGLYATISFFDSWDNLYENYKKFKTALENDGVKYVGDIFMVDNLFSFILGGKENHGYTLSVRTQK